MGGAYGAGGALVARPAKHGVRRGDYPDERTYNAAWQRAFRATPAGKAHVRRMNLKALGIAPEQYDALLKKQKGTCAVCGTTEAGRNQYGPGSFAVDHDRACCPGRRSCGECVRGLLCHNCNRAEGLLRGNAKALATYLERFAERT